MNAFLAIVLALLGIAMFSGSIWMQREWLLQTRATQPIQGMQAVSIGDGNEDGEAAVESDRDDSWATDHLLMK